MSAFKWANPLRKYLSPPPTSPSAYLPANTCSSVTPLSFSLILSNVSWLNNGVLSEYLTSGLLRILVAPFSVRSKPLSLYSALYFSLYWGAIISAVLSQFLAKSLIEVEVKDLPFTELSSIPCALANREFLAFLNTSEVLRA